MPAQEVAVEFPVCFVFYRPSPAAVKVLVPRWIVAAIDPNSSGGPRKRVGWQVFWIVFRGAEFLGSLESLEKRT